MAEDTKALRAELKAKEKAVRDEKAQADAVAAAKDKVASANLALADVRRRLLKAETKKDGDFALYFIPDGGQLFYRQGVSHVPPCIVRLPLSEDPSVTWDAVGSDGSPKGMVDEPVISPEVIESKKTGRAADKSVI